MIFLAGTKLLHRAVSKIVCQIINSKKLKELIQFFFIPIRSKKFTIEMDMAHLRDSINCKKLI